MKNIVNILTLSRIIFSILMAMNYNNKIILVILFLYCGLSDILDGYLARRYNVDSDNGAKMDTIADLVFFCVIMYILLIMVPIEILSKFIVYIVITFILKVIAIIIAWYKYKEFVILHTILNKITGILIFISTLIFFIYNNVNIYYIVIISSAIASIEEIIINLQEKTLNRDIKSILKK